MLRHAILEDGTGVWYRMLSVFVAARRLGADVPTAYVVQVAGLASVVMVALDWWRDAPAPGKYTLLVLGICLTTASLQDYDLVVGAFVVLWLIQLYPISSMPAAAMTAAALVLFIPLVGAALAHVTGLEFGPLFFAPAFLSPCKPHVAVCDHSATGQRWHRLTARPNFERVCR